MLPITTSTSSCSLSRDSLEAIYAFLTAEEQKKFGAICKLFREFIKVKKFQSIHSALLSVDLSFFKSHLNRIVPLPQSSGTMMKLEVICERRGFITTVEVAGDAQTGKIYPQTAPCGEKILIQTPDLALKLVSTKTGTCLRTFEESGLVSYMRFSNDGKIAYTVSPSTTLFESIIRRWDLETGESETSKFKSTGPIKWISSNGQKCICVESDQITLFNLITNKYIQNISRPTSMDCQFQRVVDLQINADGTEAYCLFFDQTIQRKNHFLMIWNFSINKQPVSAIVLEPFSKIISMKITPDQKKALFMCENGLLQLYNLEKREWEYTSQVDVHLIGEDTAAFDLGTKLYNIKKTARDQQNGELAMEEIKKLPHSTQKLVLDEVYQVMHNCGYWSFNLAETLDSFKRTRAPTPDEIVQAIDQIILHFENSLSKQCSS